MSRSFQDHDTNEEVMGTSFKSERQTQIKAERSIKNKTNRGSFRRKPLWKQYKFDEESLLKVS